MAGIITQNNYILKLIKGSNQRHTGIRVMVLVHDTSPYCIISVGIFKLIAFLVFY